MTISKDLFLAILSMDAYNQGYNKGLDHGKTQIGSATKKTDSTLVFTDPNADPDDTPPDEAVSFYAVAYDVPGARVDGLSDTTVISYRGTDQPGSEFPLTDFPLSTFGQWRDPQIAFAQQFYKSVKDTTNSLHLTGHSLGGALAGFTGAVNGAQATLVDHIGFTAGLDGLLTAYEAMQYEEVPGEAESYLGFATRAEAQNKYFTDNGLVDHTPESLQFLINWDWLKQFGFDGTEGIDKIQSLDFANTVGNINSFFLNGSIADLQRFDGDVPSTNTLSGYIDNYLLYLSGPAQALTAHSSVLNVIFKFAEQEQSVPGALALKFKPVLSEILEGLADKDVAKAAGFTKAGANESLEFAGKLSASIAYSALDGSEGLVFGNTGIRALFDDANELGRLVENDQLPGILSDNVDDFADLIVQFAGQMALQKVDYLNLTGDDADFAPEQGILSFFKDGVAVAQETGIDETDGADLLALNFSNKLWGITGSVYDAPANDTSISAAETAPFRNILRDIVTSNSNDPVVLWIENALGRQGASQSEIITALLAKMFELQLGVSPDDDQGLAQQYIDKILIPLIDRETLGVHQNEDTKAEVDKASWYLNNSDAGLLQRVNLSDFSDVIIEGGNGDVTLSGGHGADILLGASGQYEFYDALSTVSTSGIDEALLGFNDFYVGDLPTINWASVFVDRWANGVTVEGAGQSFDNQLTYDVYADFLDPATLQAKGLEVTKLEFGKLGDALNQAIELDIVDANTGRTSKDKLLFIDRVVLSQRADTLKVQDSWLAAPIAIDLGAYAEDGVTKDDFDVLSFADLTHGIEMVNGTLGARAAETTSTRPVASPTSDLILPVGISEELLSVSPDNLSTPLKITGAEKITGTDFADIFVFGRVSEFAGLLGDWRDTDTALTHGEISGGAGDDTIFVFDFKTFESGAEITVADGGTDIQLTEDSPGITTARGKVETVISGGSGNDWIIALGGEGVTTIGGTGKDFIYNTSKGGVIYGDTIDKLVEGTTQPIDPNSDAQSDKFWFFPETIVKDASQADFLAFYGIPLVGGTAGLPLSTSLAAGGAFTSGIGILGPGLSNIGSGVEGLYFDQLFPHIAYKYDSKAKTLTVINMLDQLASLTSTSLGELFGANSDNPTEDAFIKGAQVFENYDDFSLSAFGWGLANTGDLHQSFKADLTEFFQVLKLVQAIVGLTTVGFVASAGLQFFQFRDLLATTQAPSLSWYIFMFPYSP